MSATKKKKNQVHCLVFPTIALTENISPDVSLDKRHTPRYRPNHNAIGASVGYAHPFIEKYHQNSLGIFVCGDVTCEEVCFVDLAVVSLLS